MGRFVTVTILCILFYLTVAGQKLEIEGTYQGRNIFIKSADKETELLSCIKKIVVNRTPVSIYWLKEDGKLLEIVLDKLEEGEAVKIVISYNKGREIKGLILYLQKKIIN